MSKNETKCRNQLRKLGLVVLVFAVILIFPCGLLTSAQEVPKITDIKIMRGETATLFGKPNDTFVFSMMYSHSSGLAPRFRIEGRGQDEPVKTTYEGIRLVINENPVRMSPRIEGEFTEKDWERGVFFQRSHKFEHSGEFRIFFEVKDEKGGIARSNEYTISISDNVQPFLQIREPTENAIITEDIIVEVIAGDHDGSISDVTIEIAGKSCPMESRDTFDVWVLPLSFGSAPVGFQDLKVEATDNEGKKSSRTIHVQIGQKSAFPEIGEIHTLIEDNMCTISAKIEDEYPELLRVIINYDNIEEAMIPENGLWTYQLDLSVFDGDEVTAVIIAIDPWGQKDIKDIPIQIDVPHSVEPEEQALEEQKVTVPIPKRGISVELLTFVAAISAVGAILGIFYVILYKKRSFSAPESQEVLLKPQYVSLSLNELRRLQTQANQSQTYLTNLESLEQKNKELQYQIEKRERGIKRLQNELLSIGSRENVQQLGSIAEVLSERGLAQLVSSFARVIFNLANQELGDNSRILGNAIETYQMTRKVPTEKEHLAESEAKKSYETALAELKRAHGVLDVKVLEPFLIKAQELFQAGEKAPAGEKIPLYEASRKISETVYKQLRKPDIRNRFRKLREAGYAESLEMR